MKCHNCLNVCTTLSFTNGIDCLTVHHMKPHSQGVVLEHGQEHFEEGTEEQGVYSDISTFVHTNVKDAQNGPSKAHSGL